MSYGCFLLENLIRHRLAMLQCLVTANLRHLDTVRAKTGLSPCGFNPALVLKTKATKWCPLEPTQ